MRERVQSTARAVALLLALILWAAGAGIAGADEKATSSCCATGSMMRGVILAASPTPTTPATATSPPAASTAAVFRRADGQVFAIVTAPTLPRLPQRGLAVEVKATVVQVDGKDALRIDEVHVLKGSQTPLAERKFPLRARCAHCGCRMQIDTPQALAEPCGACKCNKTNEECLHY